MKKIVILTVLSWFITTNAFDMGQFFSQITQSPSTFNATVDKIAESVKIAGPAVYQATTAINFFTKTFSPERILAASVTGYAAYKFLNNTPKKEDFSRHTFFYSPAFWSGLALCAGIASLKYLSIY